ncbi:MAG: hypothetical protein A2664_01835 [Candidatus Taylorbacteria bacterium RIFCSPHIGHO2_01_FULL_46_22b]|uniref:Uncharacterized protein n=1 Tax=Candidatus Taylorbacteria bacterium RIFCSPHIGHO2_01_FULL_46_22b TaxID=1802301 RepID=A0A1G2M579_9BACT|nr:MAG: hypothetical protein A2664_01835 [Candidatus Taylorbacteria bacterium RIFCSPHIGHO2_01_FULL_46_22b]
MEQANTTRILQISNRCTQDILVAALLAGGIERSERGGARRGRANFQQKIMRDSIPLPSSPP